MNLIYNLPSSAKETSLGQLERHEHSGVIDVAVEKTFCTLLNRLGPTDSFDEQAGEYAAITPVLLLRDVLYVGWCSYEYLSTASGGTRGQTHRVVIRPC